MSNIEKKSRKRKSKNDIQRAVLMSIKTAGFLSMALVAPNAVQCLKLFGITPGKREKEIMERSRDRLLQNKFLKYERGSLSLTKEGDTKLSFLELGEISSIKPKKWDGRWRMLVFDIPETKRAVRQKVRTTLLHIGFLRLQDSVWIYPYDCEDFINLFKIDFKVGKDLLYIIADSIENDTHFKKLFGLPVEG